MSFNAYALIDKISKQDNAGKEANMARSERESIHESPLFYTALSRFLGESKFVLTQETSKNKAIVKLSIERKNACLTLSDLLTKQYAKAKEMGHFFSSEVKRFEMTRSVAKTLIRSQNKFANADETKWLRVFVQVPVQFPRQTLDLPSDEVELLIANSLWRVEDISDAHANEELF